MDPSLRGKREEKEKEKKKKEKKEKKEKEKIALHEERRRCQDLEDQARRRRADDVDEARWRRIDEAEMTRNAAVDRLKSVVRHLRYVQMRDIPCLFDKLQAMPMLYAVPEGNAFVSSVAKALVRRGKDTDFERLLGTILRTCIVISKITKRGLKPSMNIRSGCKKKRSKTFKSKTEG